MRHQSVFTLIELLIVIAVIAILSVVVILVLNPAELLRQSRDSNRIADMASLNSALGIYSSDQSTGSLGTINTIYVSIPDPTATSTTGDQCQGLGLPMLPANLHVSMCRQFHISQRERHRLDSDFLHEDFRRLSLRPTAN